MLDAEAQDGTAQSTTTLKNLTRHQLETHFFKVTRWPVVYSSWLIIAKENDYSIDDARKYGYDVR